MYFFGIQDPSFVPVDSIHDMVHPMLLRNGDMRL